MEDAPAFEGWYSETYRSVLASTSLFAGDADLGREATDEAFARAFAHWRRVSQMRSPSGWVMRVALNLLRRWQRRRALEARLLARRREVAALPPVTCELWMLVAQLPPRQRAAIVLRYVADLPEAEIAAVMGVARGTISSTLAAAISRLYGAVSDESHVSEASRAKP
jgi:DNA-directed RNA polymerase specialized sigma24 family protein